MEMLFGLMAIWGGFCLWATVTGDKHKRPTIEAARDLWSLFWYLGLPLTLLIIIAAATQSGGVPYNG